jgi:hypothetical protein
MNAPNPETDDQAPLRAVIGDVVTRITVLLRKEFDLARSEVAENLNRASFGAGLVVAGVILALTALNVLAVAAVVGLMTAGLDVITATLAIGVGGLIVAIAVAAAGISRVRPSRLAPTRSIRELRRSTDAAREAVDA